MEIPGRGWTWPGDFPEVDPGSDDPGITPTIQKNMNKSSNILLIIGISL